jgi:hypothetical protein
MELSDADCVKRCLRSGEVRRHNLALRRDESTAAWYVDGGF